MASPNPLPDYDPDDHTVATNREAWLQRSIDRYFRPMFAQLGYTIPATVHVSVGFGRGNSGGESRGVPGSCWSGVNSEDSWPHVFLSPVLADPAAALAVLAHMLVHATLDPVLDHGQDFKTLATAIGLEGPMTATSANLATSAEYMLMAEPDGELGPYPHSAIHLLELPSRVAAVPELVGGPARRVSSGPATQTTRWYRAVCPEHGTEAGSVRISRKTVQRNAAPLCGEPIGEPPVEGPDTRPPCGLRMEF